LKKIGKNVLKSKPVTKTIPVVIQKQILDVLRAYGPSNINEISNATGYSWITIRHYLTELELNGRVKRVKGKGREIKYKVK